MKKIYKFVFLIFSINLNNVFAMDISFVGQSPDLSGGKKLNISERLYPNSPVIFENLSDKNITLRSANPEEISNPENIIYKFERDADKNLIFYETTSPSKIVALNDKNKNNTITKEDREYEMNVFNKFFDNGKILIDCTQNNKYAPDQIIAYIEIFPDGKQKNVYILPEGSVAQCVIEKTKFFTYSERKTPFVAKFSVKINN